MIPSQDLDIVSSYGLPSLRHVDIEKRQGMQGVELRRRYIWQCPSMTYVSLAGDVESVGEPGSPRDRCRRAEQQPSTDNQTGGRPHTFGCSRFDSTTESSEDPQSNYEVRPDLPQRWWLPSPLLRRPRGTTSSSQPRCESPSWRTRVLRQWLIWGSLGHWKPLLGLLHRLMHRHVHLRLTLFLPASQFKRATVALRSLAGVGEDLPLHALYDGKIRFIAYGSQLGQGAENRLVTVQDMPQLRNDAIEGVEKLYPHIIDVRLLPQEEILLWTESCRAKNSLTT